MNTRNHSFLFFLLSLVLLQDPAGASAVETQAKVAQVVSQSRDSDSLYDPDILRKIVSIVLKDQKNQDIIKRKLDAVHSQKAFEKWMQRIKDGKNVTRKEYSYLSKTMASNIMKHLSEVAEHPDTQFELKSDDTILVTSEKLNNSIGEYARFYDIMAGRKPIPIYKLRFVIKIPSKELSLIVHEGKRAKGGFQKAIEYWRQRKSQNGRVVSIYGVV